MKVKQSETNLQEDETNTGKPSVRGLNLDPVVVLEGPGLFTDGCCSFVVDLPSVLLMFLLMFLPLFTWT